MTNETTMIEDLKSPYSNTYQFGTDRVYTVWHEEDTFYLTAQDAGMPVSYTETHATLDELITSMRDTAPLDQWMNEATWDEASDAFTSDNGYGDACDWMLTDGNTEFNETEFERYAEETYDQWTHDTDNDISFADFKRISDYDQCKAAVQDACKRHAEEQELEETLNSVVTVSEAANKLDIPEVTIRQYLNRNKPIWARKSEDTWVLLLSEAKKQWSKKMQSNKLTPDEIDAIEKAEAIRFEIDGVEITETPMYNEDHYRYGTTVSVKSVWNPELSDKLAQRYGEEKVYRGSSSIIDQFHINWIVVPKPSDKDTDFNIEVGTL